MSATLGTAPVQSVHARIPRYGVPSAVVSIADDTTLANGSRQVITIGNRSMVGTIYTGDTFGGFTAYTWEGGAAKWGTFLPPSNPYHDDRGVMLSAVLADLARDAGEIGAVLDGIVDRSLGFDWTRPAATARDLLDALSGGAWWVNEADGVTHVGRRPVGSYSSQTLTLDYDPALRRAVAQDADDAISMLLPGVTLSAPGLTAPMLIASAAIEVHHDSIAVELYGEMVGPELFRAMVAACTQWGVYLRHNPYTVASVDLDTGRVAVQPMDARAASFPDAPALSHMSGIPGATYTLARGAGVGVAYLAGDPGSPIAFGHLPGVLPTSVVVDAATTWSVGPSAVALVKDAPLQSWVAALTTACAGHGITVPALTGEATTKLMGT